MAYLNNIPQGNQQISTTQPMIQANFAYLQSGIGQEHNFDTAVPANDYHLQASMPNKSVPDSLPSGTNGQYFVDNGKAYFYDGVNNFNLNNIYAWVNFIGNPSGSNPVPCAIRSGFNITSVTKTSGGNYTILFTTPIPSANYAVQFGGMGAATTPVGSTGLVYGSILQNDIYSNSVSTSSLKIVFTRNSGALINPIMGSVVIVGF